MARKSAYTVFVGKCLRMELPKDQQAKVGFDKNSSQPVKMKKCALAWRKMKS